MDPFARPSPPYLLSHTLPEQEQPFGEAMLHNLFMMKRQSDEFASALSLFDFCITQIRHPEHGSDAIHWTAIAGRDGAMSLYHFKWAMDAIPKLFGHCATWSACADHDQIKNTRKLFDKVFPKIVHVRHTVAHSAELFESPRQSALNKHRVNGNPNNLIGGPIQSGRTYSHPYKGGIVSYQLSPHSLQLLDHIARAYYAAFYGVMEKCAPEGL